MNCAYCKEAADREDPQELSMAECCFALICDACISKHFEYCLQCGQSVSETTLIKLPPEISQASDFLPSKVCQRCSIEQATASCQQCRAHLCAHCSSHIHSLGVFSQHQLSKLEPAASLRPSADIGVLVEKVNVAKAELDSEQRLRTEEVRERFEQLQALLKAKRNEMEMSIERDYRLKSAQLSGHIEGANRVREAVERNEALIAAYSSFNAHPELFVQKI